MTDPDPGETGHRGIHDSSAETPWKALANGKEKRLTNIRKPSVLMSVS